MEEEDWGCPHCGATGEGAPCWDCGWPTEEDELYYNKSKEAL